MTTTTYPGFGPQLQPDERIMSGAVRSANSWAAAMEALKNNEEPDPIPETTIDSLPAFRSVQADAPRGKWSFICTCGQTHTYSQQTGPRPGQCEQYPRIHLLAPVDFIPQQVPANLSSTL